MRIGIVTQPLWFNYGGLLQNYALQKVLKDMGHEPITLDQVRPRPSIRHKLMANAKTFLLKLIGRGSERQYYQTERGIRKAAFPLLSFTDNYIVHTKKYISKKDLNRVYKDLQLDACIVGSDQVWRKEYSLRIENCFLDFIDNNGCIKISYAASFGVDKWNLTPEQTLYTKDCIRKFKAVSVREESAIHLCKEYWDVEASLVPDPTLLLDKDDYAQLIENGQSEPWNGDLLTYILDVSEDKQRIIEHIGKELGLKPFSVTKSVDKGEEYPSLESWLRGFRDAKFVVCDSFHGTVFSIIFNKPFVILANAQRGNTRFETLLKVFGLEERILQENDFSIIKKKIDWEEVNKRKTRFKDVGVLFLKENLKKTIER